MNSRTCDHLTAGKPCCGDRHTTVKVGIRGHGFVMIDLCYRHRNASDDFLVLLARSKLVRREHPLPLTRDDIARDLIVQDLTNLSVSRIVTVTSDSVRLLLPNGTSPGMSVAHLLKHYGLPAAFF